MNDKRLMELRASIGREVARLDQPRTYSHNIIMLTLQIIDREYGREEANQAIEDFDLESHGWEKREEENHATTT